MNVKQLKTLLIAAFAAMCLALALAGCGGNSNADASSDNADASAETSAPAESEAEEPEPEDADEGQAEAEDAEPEAEAEPEPETVTITYPRGYFETDKTDAEARAYLEEKGYTNVTKNDDGSWSVTMPADVYDAYIAALDEGLRETVDALKDSEDWPNIASTEHNEDYTEVTITLKTDKMTLTDQFAPMSVGIPISALQEASGGAAYCHITIKGSDGSVLKETTYPEAVDNTISAFLNL